MNPLNRITQELSCRFEIKVLGFTFVSFINSWCMYRSLTSATVVIIGEFFMHRFSSSGKAFHLRYRRRWISPPRAQRKNLQISGRGWKHLSIPCLQFSCRFLVTRFKNIFRFWHFCAKRTNRFANGAPNKSGSARERNIFIGISACRGRSSLFVSFTNCTIRWKMFNDCFLLLLPPCNPSDDETYV